MNVQSSGVQPIADDKSRRPKRRSLSSIQPTNTDSTVLTRSKAANNKSVKDKRSNGEMKDKALKSERITKWLTEKHSIDNDFKYWKALANERQRALEIALKENKALTEDNRRLTQELEEVKHEKEIYEQENKHLSKLAEEGVRLKEMLEEFAYGEDDEDES